MVLCYLEMLVEWTLLIKIAVVGLSLILLVILSVHMSIVLYACAYYLQGVSLHIIIEFTCNAQSINDHFICVRTTVSMYKYTVCENVCAGICQKHKLMYVYHCELRMHASLPPSSFLHCPSGKQTRAGLMLGPLTAHTFTL